MSCPDLPHRSTLGPFWRCVDENWVGTHISMVSVCVLAWGAVGFCVSVVVGYAIQNTKHRMVWSLNWITNSLYTSHTSHTSRLRLFFEYTVWGKVCVTQCVCVLWVAQRQSSGGALVWCLVPTCIQHHLLACASGHTTVAVSCQGGTLSSPPHREYGLTQ